MPGSSKNTFWSLLIEPGKTYERTVESGIHVTRCALDTSAVKSDSDEGLVQVILEHCGQACTVANLSVKHSIFQTDLDLFFQCGEEVSFTTSGVKVPVILTGLCGVDLGEPESDSDDDDYEEGSCDDTIDETFEADDDVDAFGKRKISKSSGTASKKSKLSALNDVTLASDSDSDDEHYNPVADDSSMLVDEAEDIETEETDSEQLFKLLNDDDVLLIFEHFYKIDDRANLSRVCKRFKNLIQNTSWRKTLAITGEDLISGKMFVEINEQCLRKNILIEECMLSKKLNKFSVDKLSDIGGTLHPHFHFFHENIFMFILEVLVHCKEIKLLNYVHEDYYEEEYFSFNSEEEELEVLEINDRIKNFLIDCYIKVKSLVFNEIKDEQLMVELIKKSKDKLISFEIGYSPFSPEIFSALKICIALKTFKIHGEFEPSPAFLRSYPGKLNVKHLIFESTENWSVPPMCEVFFTDFLEDLRIDSKSLVILEHVIFKCSNLKNMTVDFIDSSNLSEFHQKLLINFLGHSVLSTIKIEFGINGISANNLRVLLGQEHKILVDEMRWGSVIIMRKNGRV